MAQSPKASFHWKPHLVLFTWLLPGLGHYLVGQKARGGIIGGGIGLLWLGGLLVGSVGVINQQEHRFWFIGQAMIAPSLAVQYVTLKAQRAGRPLHRDSLSHANEQGVLLTALAGMLNLLVMLDLVYRQDSLGPYEANTGAGSGADSGADSGVQVTDAKT